jgi:uncharacterized protein YdhG (YjbR/CyaY superfamily)
MIMATEKIKFQTADEYISSFPKNVQDILEEVRAAIKKAVPDAEEVISYQIPAFKFHGWIFYYSAYTNHFSLSCPPPFTIFEEFKKELQPYELSKSTIRFPMEKPVPSGLITKMSKFRAKANMETEKTKKKK